MHPHWRLLIVPLLAAVLSVAAPAAGGRLAGPFDLNDGITFYVVDPGGAPLRATVRYRAERRRQFPQPCLVRVFGADERPVARHEFAGAAIDAGEVPWGARTFDIPAGPGGVLQVRVNAWGASQVDIELDPPRPFGVHGHLQWLCCRKGQFAEAFFHLPPGLAELPVALGRGGGRATVLDAHGKVRLSLDKANPKGTVALPPGGGRIWRLRTAGGPCQLDFAGLPIILCADEPTARAIRASVDVLGDGTLCFHKFQVRAWRLLARYRRMGRDAFDVPVEPLRKRRDEWMKQPVRNQLLLGLYGLMATFPAVLHEQNLDPNSPWFGSIATWKDPNGQPRTDNPLTDYRRLGLSSSAGLAKNLAALYSLDAPINPYHGHGGLLRRIIVASLQNLMYFAEGEHVCKTNTYYYGSHGFPLIHEHTGAFPLAVRACPPDVRAVWTEGLRHHVDRMVNSQVGGCTNQWVHIPEGIERFYWGTGEAWYRRVVLRHMRWIAEGTMWGCGQRPAGYMTEATGPDATYNGLMAHYAAHIYQRTRCPLVLRSLKRCYRLLNHTIAPEPDGTWVGSSSFCCRTPGDWTGPQYGGGLAMMADELGEAGIRAGRAWVFPRPPADDAQLRQARERLDKSLTYYPPDILRREPANLGRASGAFDIHFPVYLNWPVSLKTAPLPCQEPGRFQRSFGGEFFCIKRPGYYVFIYAGVAMAEWLKASRPRDANHQYPHNDGGICLLWSSDVGCSILAKNWSAYAANTVIATLPDGQRVWPDYWSVKHTFDERTGSLAVTGRLIDLPVSFRRTYEFPDDRIVCRWELSATEPVRLKRLVFCFPHPPRKARPTSIQPIDPAGGSCGGFRIAGPAGKGHRVVFAARQRIDAGMNRSVDHYKGKHTYGRVLVEAPTRLAPGETVTLAYQILTR